MLLNAMSGATNVLLCVRCDNPATVILNIRCYWMHGVRNVNRKCLRKKMNFKRQTKANVFSYLKIHFHLI